MEVIRKELASVFHFVKKPVFEPVGEGTNKFLSFGIILLFDVLIMLVLLGLLEIINTPELEEIFETYKLLEMEQLSPAVLLFSILILAPIMEETIFRLPLKFRSWMTIGLILILIILLNFFVDQILKNELLDWIMRGISLFFLVIIIANPQTILAKARQLWLQKFYVVFYFSTLLFAITHAANYSLSLTKVYLIPLLVLPQFVIGLLLGYIRVKLGFFWGVGLHATHNFIFAIPFIIGLYTSFPAQVIEKEDYYLKIEKSEASSLDTKHMVSEDSIIIDNLPFKDVIELLLDKEETYIIINNKLINETRFNIQYKTKGINADSKYFKANILEEMQNTYGFKVQRENRTRIRREIVIVDSLKMKQIITQGSVTKSTLQDVGDQLSLEDGKISLLVEGLNELYGDEAFFFTNLSDDFSFSLTLDKRPLPELKQSLENQYGLSLQERDIKEEYVEVIFD